jgi:hypothetical protein
VIRYFLSVANMKRRKVKNPKKFAAIFCVGIALLIIAIYPTKEKKVENSFLKLSGSSLISSETKTSTIFHKIADDVLYICAGLVLEPISYLARLAWGVSLISPWASTLGNEFLLFSHLCYSSAKDVLSQLFNETPSSNQLPSFHGVRPSHSSWHLNKLLLSQVPAFSDEEKQLLFFLEKHWLAKVTGFYPLMVNWVCPCFGMCLQVHPETTSSYSRNPANKFSQTYTNIVNDWKQLLPHPQHYPLILTRPFDVQDFLPAYLDVPKDEEVRVTVKRLALKMQSDNVKPVVDLTRVFPDDIKDRKEWTQIWREYRTHFLQKCKEYDLDSNRIICIQRVRQQAIGGIRILPLSAPFADQLESHFQSLLEWISTLGLSANRIELDRYSFPTHHSPMINPCISPISMESKTEFLSYLALFDQNWKSDLPHEVLLVKGTLQVLEGLLTNLTEEKWNKIIHSPTRSIVVQLSFLKIKKQLEILLQKKNEIYFFDTIEQIHADLSSLLEIFAPFSVEDFPSIYKDVLTIPSHLKSLTSYGIHAAGMTSLTGIFKAVEKTVGSTPRVLYGENTYFECINVAERISKASPVDQATEEDFQQVDLILGQFNPVLRRIDFEIAEYKVEKIAETLHKVLSSRKGKPLTLVLDCTLDFIDSPRVSQLLNEFQQEIEMGVLNIICYRSGLKFDIFGMDNYCGAPFFMIHNQDKKWTYFDLILNDPALQTDQLSFNWFCLAYKCAANQLELYRKQIFDNTRALLNKLPKRLLDVKRGNYRIIPVEESANPAFLDIKIFGPFHEIRGGILAGGCLYLKCMEENHPIFYRPSLGLYHPNFSMIFCKNFTTIRLTLGLDPAQIDILAKSIEIIDSLNGSSWQSLTDKLCHSSSEQQTRF